MLDSLAIVFDCRRVHSRDVLFQRLTLDKSHGIAETAVRRFSKPVNWHDAWMIQPRGNYGFELKLLTAIAAVAMFRPDEFQNDIALKFAVVGNVYFAQSPPRVKLQFLIRLLNDECPGVRIPRTFGLNDRRHSADFRYGVFSLVRGSISSIRF